MLSLLTLLAGVAIPLHSNEAPCAWASSLSSFYALGDGPPLPKGVDAPTDTDVLSYDLKIEAVPSTEEIIGSNTITVKSLVANLTEFKFRLRSNYTITAIRLNGNPITFVRDSTTDCRAILGQAFNPGEVFQLYIEYNGVAVSRGFGSIEFGNRSNGQPYVFTLSQPYYAYTWWPGKDDNTDKALVNISITVPNTMVVASNGLLQSIDTVSGGKLRYNWRTNYPIADYLVCFGATNFNQFSDTFVHPGGNMPVTFYIWPESDNTTNRNAWRKCVTMLETFTTIFGPYPFLEEKYGIYQFTFSGGMEHQTMTGQGTFSESVTAHELGHQWWGDSVTCGTWSDIWLNEGFATYSEALWEENKPGSSGLPALKAAMAARRPTSFNGSVYRYDTSSTSTIFSTNFAYRKGAWVLHQLRHIVGDEKFFEILAQYRKDFEYSAAITDNFAAVASNVYGQDLTWYFQPWIYEVGAPAYQWGWQPAVVNAKNYLLLHITQSQSTSYPTYTMPIDIRPTVNGQKQFLKVWNNARTQHYVLPLTAPATACTFDEDAWILSQTVSSVSYVPGPPKIVETFPLPGSIAPLNTTQVKVTFHTPVNAASANFTVVGDATGSRSFSYTYDAGSNTAVLTFASLPIDTYTLTVSDAITATNSGQRLDGEISNPNSPSSLPSGNGLPLGNALIRFKVGFVPVPPPSTRGGPGIG